MKKTVLDNKSKVFIIGLDGAAFDIIHPLIERGKLHNIAALMANGSYSRLGSTIPPISPVAWTSFATGKNPGKHGIYDFLGRLPNSYGMRLNNANIRCSEPIWNLLSKAGKKVGIINVTMSYPPDKVNGFMISGMDTPSDNTPFTYPSGLYKELKKKFGKHIFTFQDRAPERFDEGIEKSINSIHEEIQYRSNITEYLMKTFSWDFFVTVFLASDAISHFCWKYMDVNHPQYDSKLAGKYGSAINNVYEKLDDAVGRLVNSLGEDTTIIILSDHGFGPVHTVFYINKWLCDMGYLKFKEKFDNKRSYRMFPSLRKGLKKFLPEQFLGKFEELRKFRTINPWLDINWSETRAFSEGTCGPIFINLKGREPGGVVNPGSEYDQLRIQIISDLMKFKASEGNDSIVRKVYKKEDIFHGNFVHRAPDLLIELNSGYESAGKFQRVLHGGELKHDCLFQSDGWSGNHRSDGVLIIKGPQIKKARKIIGAEIIDIAPTALYLMGLPVPKDMDGKILKKIVDDDYLNKNPVTFSVTDETGIHGPEENFYSQEDEKKVKERLRNLGYME